MNGSKGLYFRNELLAIINFSRAITVCIVYVYFLKIFYICYYLLSNQFFWWTLSSGRARQHQSDPALCRRRGTRTDGSGRRGGEIHCWDGAVQFRPSQVGARCRLAHWALAGTRMSPPVCRRDGVRSASQHQHQHPSRSRAGYQLSTCTGMSHAGFQLSPYTDLSRVGYQLSVFTGMVQVPLRLPGWLIVIVFYLCLGRNVTLSCTNFFTIVSFHI